MDIGQLIETAKPWFNWMASPFSLASFGAIVGAGITSAINLAIKHLEYRQAFYKEIIQRRLKAFDELNEVIQPFWKAQEVAGIRAFNVMFYAPEDLSPLHDALMDSGMKNSAWITREAKEALRSLSDLLDTFPGEDLVLNSDPKRIAAVANEMEKRLLKAQLELERNFHSIYDVKGFIQKRQNWLDLFVSFR